MAKTPLFQFTLRPNRRVKRIWTECPAADLKRASSQALYEGSPYHRRRQSGQLSATRGYPFASKCDPKWTIAEATKALRAGSPQAGCRTTGETDSHVTCGIRM